MPERLGACWLDPVVFRQLNFYNNGDKTHFGQTLEGFYVPKLWIEIIDKSDLLDATILRSEKTYPAYFGTYQKFGSLQQYLDKFENLFLIGRNGMHKYNNTDHSMLTAMTAVDNIIQNVKDKSNIWHINPENEYIETKKNV
jgi:hypothetical protein